MVETKSVREILEESLFKDGDFQDFTINNGDDKRKVRLAVRNMNFAVRIKQLVELGRIPYSIHTVSKSIIRVTRNY